MDQAREQGREGKSQQGMLGLPEKADDLRMLLQGGRRRPHDAQAEKQEAEVEDRLPQTFAPLLGGKPDDAADDDKQRGGVGDLPDHQLDDDRRPEIGSQNNGQGVIKGDQSGADHPHGNDGGGGAALKQDRRRHAGQKAEKWTPDGVFDVVPDPGGEE